MPISESDPRVFFAAERTLLAWLRTGLTIMGLGFVVSRFGLFMQLLAAQSQPPAHAPHSGVSAALGVAFVVVGSVSMLVSAAQHSRFVVTLQQPDLPPAYSTRYALALSYLVGALGLVLAAYLVATQA